MGNLISNFSFRKEIENRTFFPPKPSYKSDQENLIFIPSNNSYTKHIACIEHKINNKKLTVIYSHGNATDIGKMEYFLSRLSKDIGVNIISYDYEGYGLTGGKPTEQGCIRAINAVYDYVIKQGSSPNDIILYGASIGTGPTIDLASRISLNSVYNKDPSIDLRGILLQSPYTSVAAVAHESIETSLNISSSICENPNIFRSIEKISNITSPIIILHGTNDEVIPYSHSTKLKNANADTKLILIPSGTHNDIETEHYYVIKKYINALIMSFI